MTNYEYAQVQEEKQLREFISNMPETQIINSYKTLNRELTANEQAKKQREAQVAQLATINQGSFQMQDNIPVDNSVRNTNIGDNLYMAQAEVSANQQESNRPEEEESELGEQLIKDSKTSSGVSQS